MSESQAHTRLVQARAGLIVEKDELVWILTFLGEMCREELTARLVL